MKIILKAMWNALSKWIQRLMWELFSGLKCDKQE